MPEAQSLKMTDILNEIVARRRKDIDAKTVPLAKNADEYELFISPVTLEELGDAKSDEKRKATVAFLETIRYTELPKNDEAEIYGGS
jgi:hypothetical protein